MYHLRFANHIQEDFASLKNIKINIIVSQTVFSKQYVINPITDLYVRTQQHNAILLIMYAHL